MAAGLAGRALSRGTADEFRDKLREKASGADGPRTETSGRFEGLAAGSVRSAY